MVVQDRRGLLGRYSIGVATGVVAAGAATDVDVFQFRWSPTGGQLCGIRKFLVSAYPSTANSSGTPTIWKLWRATGFTACGTTNAVATSPDPGTGGKHRTTRTNGDAVPSSLVADEDMQILDTNTAGITGETATPDAHPLVCITGTGAQSLQIALMAPTLFLDQRNPEDPYPVLLAQDEGLLLTVTKPATIVYTGAVTMEWDELTGA